MQYLQIIGFLLIEVITYYVGINKNTTSKILALITESELAFSLIEESGEQKMKYVMDRVRVEIIPWVLRDFIPDAWVKSMIQKIFDQTQKFVLTQIDKILTENKDY